MSEGAGAMPAPAVPLELRERPQWVLWRLEARDGRPTKVPYRVDDPSRRASSTDPSTWATFGQALERVADADGVGFVFSADDGYCGVDLDGCLDDRGLVDDDVALLAVTQLDSYTEVSPSGTGLHVFVRATLNGGRRRKGNVEMYDAGRFFCVTGRHLAGTPAAIAERQTQLDAFRNHVFGSPEPLSPKTDEAVGRADENDDEPAGPPRPASVPLDLDDGRLLEKARAARNGDKFDRLWHGDQAGYGSPSEADLALCGMLAFWTGGDPGHVDALFRRSGLYRPKWDERRGDSSYGADTVAAALTGRSDFYTAGTTSTAGPARVTADGADRADGHTWQALDLVALASRPPEPPAIGGLLYPGKRHVVSGEAEAGKSWLLLALAAGELRDGRGVVWVDSDGMGAGDVLERLRNLAVPDEQTTRLFAFLQPADPLTETSVEHVRELLLERESRLLVLDAFNAALGLHGLDPAKTPDVERFWGLLDAFRQTGAAVALPDHVVKNRENRGRYSYGSERKHSGADVHLGMATVEPFGRGRTGRAKLTVHKDRPGFLERPSPGLFVVTSDPDTGACSWKLVADETVSADGTFRPTVLMEKVSRYLEFAGQPRSRNQIEEDVKGKRDYIRTAIDTLIREGFAVDFPGDRGARLVKLETAFRESDEANT